MRTETMRSRMVYNRPLPITRIVSAVGESKIYFGYLDSLFHFSFLSISNLFSEAQINTQRYGRRPYGVGLIVAGHDVSLFFMMDPILILQLGIWSSFIRMFSNWELF